MGDLHFFPARADDLQRHFRIAFEPLTQGDALEILQKSDVERKAILDGVVDRVMEKFVSNTDEVDEVRYQLSRSLKHGFLNASGHIANNWDPEIVRNGLVKCFEMEIKNLNVRAKRYPEYFTPPFSFQGLR